MDWELILLCLASAAAGAVNSVAGGGTLLTFPTLMAILGRKLETPELAAVVANQTSTLALMPGSLASAWGYRRELVHSAKWLRWLLPPSIIGGVAGALLVTEFPEKAFKTLVPWLILTAALLFALQPQISRWTGIGRPHEEPSGRRIAGIMFFQLLVAIYGGYFGAGIGILMLTALAMMGLADIHSMNALKTVLAAVINGGSVAIFLTRGRIDWQYALPMTVAAIIGGYLGAAVALRINRTAVRWIIIAIGFTLAATYFYREFAG